MARAELRRERAILRQRQQAAGRDQALAAHDGRAVVQRRVRDEDVQEEVRRDEAVNLDARRADVVEAHVALDDNERARLIGGHDLDRLGELAHDRLRFLVV